MDTNIYNAANQLPEAEIAANEAAIRTLLQRLNESWGDTDAYAALFTEDADYVAFDGSHARGRNEIAEVHRPLFEGILKGSRLVEVGMPVEV
ncbi:MAG TPA: SgcJ/EcaC family oxidoreductase, partial [Ktedonobacteraceae bacterium]|nr:SgcJ/EcaC family oxidoreductase [Ktedonobacteraceae bacterium]